MSPLPFAQQVLTALATLVAASKDGAVPVNDLSHALFLQTRLKHKFMLNTLSQLRKSGRVVRVRQGVYTVIQRDKPPEIREVMWRLLRMRKRVTVLDLVEMAGAGQHYAQEWLRALTRQGITRQAGKNYLLLQDSVAMPVNEEAASKHRARRQQQKQKAQYHLAEASAALAAARAAIDAMEDLT